MYMVQYEPHTSLIEWT